MEHGTLVPKFICQYFYWTDKDRPRDAMKSILDVLPLSVLECLKVTMTDCKLIVQSGSEEPLAFEMDTVLMLRYSANYCLMEVSILAPEEVNAAFTRHTPASEDMSK